MSLPPDPNRTDYTRWNRAGRPRFDYVDGDPAVWLEELRVALLTRYMRQSPDDMRTMAVWRDLFMRLETGNQDQADLISEGRKVDWDALMPPVPGRAETRMQRNERLLDQYEHAPRDYAWEIARAFARALHVQLGHLNAYANEGYLRTASQWDNVRKLAAMVNYQPSPPASASTHIALDLKADSPKVTVRQGLAMKHTPESGGKPLIYETTEDLEAHPALNALRARGWDLNLTPIDFSGPTEWMSDSEEGLSAGQHGVLVRYRPDGSLRDQAKATLLAAQWDKEDGYTQIQLNTTPSGQWRKAYTELYVAPEGILKPLPQTTSAGLVLKVGNADGFGVGSIVRITREDGRRFRAVVKAARGAYLTLRTPHRPSGSVQIERFIPFGGSGNSFTVPNTVTTLYFRRETGAPTQGVSQFTTVNESRVFTRPAGCTGLGYALNSDPDAPRESGEVVSPPDEILDQAFPVQSRVRIEGKPPKTMAVGDWFLSESDAGQLKALRLMGFKTESGFYIAQFNKRLTGLNADMIIHGRFTRLLRPLDYDRNPNPAFEGQTLILDDVPEPARALLKPGKNLLIDLDEGAGEDAQLVPIKRLSQETGLWVIELDTDADLTGWISGYTSLRANCVGLSHGETKSSKVLGSGNGELARQSFDFNIKDISFIPSSVAEAGVAPALTVRVEGAAWDYRDYTDPSAEGEAAYSITQLDDGSLRFHFRRRLPSGRDNAVISTYRVGHGLAGNDCPSNSLTKPMKKHAYVEAVHQPFALAGGAERESVTTIRENAPARLAANGRAVSLQDFARLTQRHSSVWQARAHQLPTPHGAGWVRLTIVPAGGGTVSDSLKTDLIDTLRPKTLPGLRLTVEGFSALTLSASVKIHGDWDVYDKGEVRQAAQEALVSRFRLEDRGLGQVFYISEILSVLEQLTGVTGATIQRLAIKSGTPARTADTGGKLSTIYPREDQVAFIEAPYDVSVQTEPLL